MPLLGFWLDHSTDTTSPLVARFRRYGKFLVFGQRSGQPPEAILLSIASLARGAEIRTMGRVFRHDVAIGYDRRLRSYLDHQGGFLSGACLPDGLWLDADSARREEHGLRAAASVDPMLARRLAEVAADPPRPDGPAGALATDDAAGVALRLLRKHLEDAGGDRWGVLAVLRAHESGHVLDLARHLPVARGLPATAGLLASEGFSIARVEARIEGRAQLAAVCDSRYPRLALVELVRSLPDASTAPEAHERGYRDVVGALLEHLHAHANRYPALDPTRKLLPQLDRLSSEEVRAAARAVAAGCCGGG